MTTNGHHSLLGRLWMIFVALFLAFGVWFYVSAPRRENVSERAFAAPLSLVGMPRDLIITTPVPDSVSVRLRGRVSDLRSLSSQNLEVTVELSWAQPGEAVITLRPQAINVPPQVEVASINPTKIRFRVDQLRQKAVPIRAFLVGQTPDGYIVGEPALDPARALISGPLSQLRNVTEVATERIIMTGRTSTFVQNAAVVSDSSLVRVVDPQTTQVTVPVNAAIGPMPPADTTGTTATTDTTSSGKKAKP